MFGVQKQQLKHLSKQEYTTLQLMCRLAKNMYNVALYNIRQHYFAAGLYLSYTDNYHLSKTNENYKLLNKNMAQQIIKVVDRNFKSFFELLKLKRQGQYNNKVNIPHYLEKDGYFNLIFSEFNTDGDYFTVPMSPAFRKEYSSINIRIPSNLKGKIIKEIRIIPKSNARFFEIQYVYEVPVDQRELNYAKALAIDLGVNNLATCVTSDGHTFIINGKRLKSVNQWFNKENARLQSIKDKQKINTTTTRQQRLNIKRNNRVNDYINKAVRYIINYCLDNQIGNIVVGYNPDFQRYSDIGRSNNQSFVNIPLGKFITKLGQQSERETINFMKQEESYTSKADFFANDEIPIYDSESSQTYQFSGRRIKRGVYKTSAGQTLNADAHSAANILRKSKLVDISILQSRGSLDQPKRIRVA